MAAVSSPSLHNLTLPQIVPQKGGGGGPVPPPIFTGGTTVRTVTPAQNIPSSGGNPSFQRLRVSITIVVVVVVLVYFFGLSFFQPLIRSKF